MSAKIIDGKVLASKHQEQLLEKIKKLHKMPTVISLLVGNNKASLLYTRMKQKKAEELGIAFCAEVFAESVSFMEVMNKIEFLNNEPEITGIMVQLPLPDEFLGSHKIGDLVDLIDSRKDIDGLGKNSHFLPATAKAVLSILKDEKIPVEGKSVVVIGRSQIVGKPIAEELIKMGAKVTVVHRQTEDPAAVCKGADILISSAGVAHLVKVDWVKDGAVVIDIGTNHLDGKLVGDVDFETVSKKASQITPVPGGVGPMTVISLMENICEAVLEYPHGSRS